MNNISAIQEYDVYTPGQDFLFTSKDNMFVAWKVGEPVTMMQYIRKTMLQYQKEWLNGLTLTTWARNENNEAAGTLRYDRYNADGTLTNLKSFTNTELGASFVSPRASVPITDEREELAFHPLERRSRIQAIPSDGIEERVGGRLQLQPYGISAEKRIWLSSFGHIDPW